MAIEPIIQAGVFSRDSLDKINENFAELSARQSGFGIIAVDGQDPLVAAADSDTLTFAAGSNITLTTDDNTDALTISATGLDGDPADVSVDENMSHLFSRVDMTEQALSPRVGGDCVSIVPEGTSV